MRGKSHFRSGERADVYPKAAPPKPILRKHLAFLDRHLSSPHRPVPKLLQINRIDAIGAIYDNAAGLDPYDQHWIGRTFAFFRGNNLIISQRVRIFPWDLATGHDILAATGRPNATDVWILCWVWNPRS